MALKYNSDNVLPQFRHFYGYLDATDDIVGRLERFTTTATNYEELKSEILNLCAGKRIFLKKGDDLTINSNYPRLITTEP